MQITIIVGIIVGRYAHSAQHRPPIGDVYFPTNRGQIVLIGSLEAFYL